MARFDDWATDREVTTEKARAFVDNPDRIGEPFLGKYLVATTSGTTGMRGIFVMDERSLAVTQALALHMLSAWLGIGGVIRIVAGGRDETQCLCPISRKIHPEVMLLTSSRT